MRNLFILAVAASFAVACAGRTEDEMGAAPERGDTTAVIDDTTAVVADTAQTYPTDTTMGQVETDTSFVEPDTTFADPGMDVDTTTMETDTTTTYDTGADTTAAGEWSDTTTVAPTDSVLPAE